MNDFMSPAHKHNILILALATLINTLSHADTTKTDPEEQESPWLITPTLSKSPKLGSSFGFLGGYLLNFDKKSPASMLALAGNYSSTDSEVYGGFANLYFDEDKQRLIVAHGRAKIENEYGDYLGTGLNINTRDDARFSIIRYLHRVPKNWFVGAQLVQSDYQITGKDIFSQAVLSLLGIEGFNGNAAGIVAEHDTRDRQNTPSDGHYFQLTTTRYLESLNSDVEFGVSSAKYARYDTIFDSQVLATRVATRFTNDAPISGYSSVRLRGYTAGEYLAPNNVDFQVEDRIRLSSRWGATIFTGAACLFGDGEDCSDRDNWFPNIGAGITYALKPNKGMVVRTEIAKGKNDNLGIYIQFGDSF